MCEPDSCGGIGVEMFKRKYRNLFKRDLISLGFASYTQPLRKKHHSIFRHCEIKSLNELSMGVLTNNSGTNFL